MLVIIVWITTVLFTAIIFRKYFPENKELSRKVVHIGTGPVIPICWYLAIPTQLATYLAFLVTIGLIINHRFRLVPAVEDVQRQTYGTIAYGVSITFLLALLWQSDPAAVSAGVLIMAFGDGFAGLIGRQVKSPSWKVFGQRKSIAGTLSMACIGIIILVLIAKVSNASLDPLQIIAISGFAVALEQIGPWGIDNLTVPIGVASAWTLMAGG